MAGATRLRPALAGLRPGHVVFNEFQLCLEAFKWRGIARRATTGSMLAVEGLLLDFG